MDITIIAIIVQIYPSFNAFLLEPFPNSCPTNAEAAKAKAKPKLYEILSAVNAILCAA